MALTDDFKTPGQYLQHLLDDRGWNQVILAIVLGVPQGTISQILSGKQRVTAQFALALAEVFDVPVEDFMILQQAFELASARVIAKPDPARNTRAHLFGGLPIADMIKRGWLPGASSVRDIPSVERELSRFFGVKQVNEIEILPHAAKRTEVSIDATPVQLAWLYRVKQIAQEILVARFSTDAAKSAVPKLQALLASKEEARKVPRILAEAGIRFVLAESLPGAKIDGACFWLDDTSPVIGMTMRYDRIDNFWFVLRHELEHVIRGHGKDRAILDAELEGERAGIGAGVDEEERIANQAASEFCVPQKLLRDFIARKAPFFAQQDVIGFASMLKVHPGLVAGQIRHATSRYDLFTAQLVKIRTVVAPNAVVDGWGDIAPVAP